MDITTHHVSNYLNVFPYKNSPIKKVSSIYQHSITTVLKTAIRGLPNKLLLFSCNVKSFLSLHPQKLIKIHLILPRYHQRNDLVFYKFIFILLFIVSYLYFDSFLHYDRKKISFCDFLLLYKTAT